MQLSGKTTSFSLGSVHGLCADCGAPFEGPAFQINGTPTALRQLRCDPCISTWETRRAAELQQGTARKVENRRWLDVCPPLYSNTDLNRIPAQNRETARKIQSWPNNARGILLSGPSGVGKSRTLVKLMERLWYEGLTVRMFFGQQFGHECSKQFGRHQGESWMEELIHADILLLDDIGKLVLTDRTERELFSLLDERFMYQRPVFTTTNSTGDQIQSGLRSDIGGAMVGRLRRFCEFIAFT